MTKLTDTQAVILTTAAQRERLLALPFPDTLKVRAGAATKVVDAMLDKALLAETPACADDPVWSETDDSGAITLVVTADGLAAIGIEPEGADQPDAETAPSAATEAGPGARKAKARPEAPHPQEGRPGGAQGDGRGQGHEAVPAGRHAAPAGGRQHQRDQRRLRVAAPYHPRGIAGALRRKLGLPVESQKVEGRGTVYKLPA